MKKILLKIAVAFVVLLGLLTLNWWKVQQTEKKETQESADKKLVSIDAEKIQKIELLGDGSRAILERRKKDEQGNHQDEFAVFDRESALSSGWLITDPYRDLADQTLVSALIDGIQAVESVKTIQDDNVQPEVYGLDRPSFEVRIFAGGDPISLKIGKVNSSGAYYYAQSSMSPRIVLVDKNIDYNAKKDVQEWRDKKILPYKNIAAVDRVRVNYAGTLGKYLFQKTEDAWTMIQPKKLPAQTMAVEGIVRSIHTAIMKSIVSEHRAKDAAKYGLTRPMIEVMTSEKDGDQAVEKKFWVGRLDAKKGALYVAREGSDRIFEVNPTLKEDLTRTFGQFVAKNAFTAKEADLQKVTIRRGSETTVLVKKDGPWIREGDDSSREFKGMFKVKNFDAVDYIGEKYPVSGSPTLEIVLDTASGPQSVQLYPEPKKENYIGWVSRHNLYYRFLKQDVDGIVHDLDVLLGLKVEEHPTGDGHDHEGEHGHE